ncbi:hypothetical protein DSECCO2_652830 [anaerobic digester metagenome]
MPELSDIGLPEEVDGLFGVADDEKVPRLPAEDRVNNSDLDGIGVLELVDQDKPEPVPEVRRDIRVVGKEPVGTVDQVVEVESVSSPFFRFHRPGEGAVDRAEVVEEVERRPCEGVGRVDGRRAGSLVVLETPFQDAVGRPEAFEVVSRPVLFLSHICPEPRTRVDPGECCDRVCSEVRLDGPEVGLGRVPFAGVAGGKVLERLKRGAGTVEEGCTRLRPLSFHGCRPGVEHNLLAPS